LVKISYEKFDALAREHHVTAYKVAKDIGISNVVFSEWKNEKCCPKTEKLKLIADYFGVTIEDLLEEIDEE